MVLTLVAVDLSSVAMSNATGPSHPPIFSVYVHLLSAPPTQSYLLRHSTYYIVPSSTSRDARTVTETFENNASFISLVQVHTVRNCTVFQLPQARSYQTTFGETVQHANIVRDKCSDVNSSRARLP